MTVQEAEGVLAADPVFGGLIERWGPCPLGRAGQRGGSHFEALARSVTGQQLAGAAVQAIWLRVRALVPGRFTPDVVAALTFEQLRGAGLSGAKARTIADLAARVVDGRLRLASIARLPDDELVADLSEVWGIGRWTAEMFAMFQLGRLDIWPTGDLGVRNGYGLAHDLPTAPTPAALEAAGERFRPWRSVVAWYCWRAVEESRGVPPTRVLAVPTDQ